VAVHGSSGADEGDAHGVPPGVRSGSGQPSGCAPVRRPC